MYESYTHLLLFYSVLQKLINCRLIRGALWHGVGNVAPGVENRAPGVENRALGVENVARGVENPD